MIARAIKTETAQQSATAKLLSVQPTSHKTHKHLQQDKKQFSRLAQKMKIARLPIVNWGSSAETRSRIAFRSFSPKSKVPNLITNITPYVTIERYNRELFFLFVKQGTLY